MTEHRVQFISHLYFLSLRCFGKRLLLLVTFLLFAIIFLPSKAQADRRTNDLLSAMEREYLAQLGPITIAPDPDWLPFEHIDEQGNFTGIAADLLRLVEERLDIRFVYLAPTDWGEAVALSQQREALILPFLNQTPARDQWLVFTEPLLVDPNVFVTREEHTYIFDPAQLENETLVLPAGTSIEERIRRDYPNLNIMIVASENDVFRAVADGRADMTLRSLAVSAYTLRKEGLFNLKIAGHAPSDAYTNYLRVGVYHSEPLLRDILDKGIRTITAGEREEILNRHINITMVTPTDYGPLLRISAFLLLLIAVSCFWTYRLKRVNAALAESERSKSVLISNLPGMAYRCRYDADWTMEFISNGCIELTGYQPQDLVKNQRLSFNDLMVEEDRQPARAIWALAEKTRQPARLEYRITTVDGKVKWVFEQGSFIYNSSGQIEAIEGLIIDVTDRKKAEEELHRISINDELTGLYNRRFVLQQFERVYSEYRRSNQDFAVAMIDIDHFKSVNDIYGHQTGDYVLKEFARVLLEGSRPYDLVGRFGGEEFILVIMNIRRPLACSLLERLKASVSRQVFEYNGSCLNLTFSAGIAMAHEAGAEGCPDTMIRLADERLYLAKKRGRDRVVCQGDAASALVGEADCCRASGLDSQYSTDRGL